MGGLLLIIKVTSHHTSDLESSNTRPEQGQTRLTFSENNFKEARLKLWHQYSILLSVVKVQSLVTISFYLPSVPYIGGRAIVI